MNPFLENLVISLCTGLLAAGGAFQALPPNGELNHRVWIGLAVAGVIGFAGSLVNGLRQKQKDPAS